MDPIVEPSYSDVEKEEVYEREQDNRYEHPKSDRHDPDELSPAERAEDEPEPDPDNI